MNISKAKRASQIQVHKTAPSSGTQEKNKLLLLNQRLENNFVGI